MYLYRKNHKYNISSITIDVRSINFTNVFKMNVKFIDFQCYLWGRSNRVNSITNSMTPGSVAKLHPRFSGNGS